MQNIFSEIETLRQAAPIVIGVNGLDCAGKTTFAKALYDDMRRRDVTCRLLHIDDYNNLAVQKQVYEAHQRQVFNAALLDLYYQDSIDYQTAAQAILSSRKDYDVTLIEGVFLFKDCLAPLLDIKVFLSVDPDTARDRYAKRRIQVGDRRLPSVFDDIWLPAFRRYCDEVQPADICDLTYGQCEE